MAPRRRPTKKARTNLSDAATAREATSKRRFTRRQKWVASTIAAASLGAIGTALGTWLVRGAETATKQVLRINNPPDAPIEVRVTEPGTYSSAHTFAPYYIVPKDRTASPDDLAKAEAANESTFFDYGWAKRNGAVAGSPQIVRLQIRAKADEPTTVNEIRVRVVKRSQPVEGWYVASPACGVEPVRIAAVDLDQPQPDVQFFDEAGRPKRLTLSVRRTDLEIVELQADSDMSTVEWVADVFYSGPEGDGSITVSDKGRPFRVSSERASDGYTLAFANETDSLVVQREPSWDANGITAC